MKIIFPFLLATTFLFSCTNKSTTKNTNQDSLPDTTQTLTNTVYDPLDMAGIEFGFCDTDGKKILLLADTLLSPSQFSKVFSADHKLSDVRYIEMKKATEEDNGRQNEFNFKNCKGYLFEVKENAVTSAHTVVCVTAAFISSRKIIPVRAPVIMELSTANKARIETAKNRQIREYRCLALLGKDSAIYLFEFDNIGESALATLAYVTPGKIIYQDFPAQYNDMSTWRVDDGGRFGVGYFEVLAIFEKNGKLEIVTDWPGAEGTNTEFLRENGNELKPLKGYARYTAPE